MILYECSNFLTPSPSRSNWLKYCKYWNWNTDVEVLRTLLFPGGAGDRGVGPPNESLWMFKLFDPLAISGVWNFFIPLSLGIRKLFCPTLQCMFNFFWPHPIFQTALNQGIYERSLRTLSAKHFGVTRQGRILYQNGYGRVPGAVCHGMVLKFHFLSSKTLLEKPQSKVRFPVSEKRWPLSKRLHRPCVTFYQIQYLFTSGLRI